MIQDAVILWNNLRKDLHWLRGEDGVIKHSEAVAVLARILAPLLYAEGLVLFAPDGPGGSADLIASTPVGQDSFQASVAINYKHHGQGRPIGIEDIDPLMGVVSMTPYDRALLVGRFGYTAAAHKHATELEPVSVELMDLSGIEAWIARSETGRPSSAARIELLIRSVSHAFAQLVAESPDTLDHLEWRDLERMMARVMEGLGFKTTLTPPSKDGGKDLILACETVRGEESYIVELKHWRSGKRVGKQSVSDFVKVIVAENRSGGLFVSTSGYAADMFEGLTEITRQRVRIGNRTKVILLAQTYMRSCTGLWSPPTSLPEVLFEATQ